MLAVVATPCSVFGQPEAESAPNDAQEQLVARIQELEALGNRDSADLIELWTALGLFHQESGDHLLAIAAFQRALQVVRANYGLYSLDQAPLIRQLIYSAEATGNTPAAWDLEQELLILAGRHPDDLRTAPIFHEIADKRIDVLGRYLDGEFPPQIILGCYYDARRFGNTRNCRSGSRRVAVQSILTETHGYYLDAIEVISRHERYYANDELRELEMKLVRSSYLYGVKYRYDDGYDIARESLQRLADYEDMVSAPLLTRIDALVRVADWDLLFSRDRVLFESALEIYMRAYEELEREGAAQESIDEIFAPKTPIVIPTFLPNPLALTETPASTGYIDIAFEITKYGQARNIEILETTMNATHAAETGAVRLIKSKRFRPRVTQGQFADGSPIVVRYYLND